MLPAKRLFKRWGTQVVAVFVRKRTFKVSQYFSIDLKDESLRTRRCTEVGISSRPEICFSTPKLNKLILGRLVKWRGELIMVTLQWLDWS